MNFGRKKRHRRTSGFATYITCVSLAVLMLLLSAALSSCSGVSKKISTEEEEKPEQMFLITDETPNCSMIISDEAFNYLNKTDDYSYLLDLMNDYFNIVINNEIDPYTVYIKAVSTKIDAEVRLAEVYEPSNRVSFMIQMAEAGKSALQEYTVSLDQEPVVSQPTETQEDPDDPKYQLRSEVIASLKSMAGKASVYSVKAIKDEFKEKTNQIYSKSDKIIKKNNIETLKYNDYYINIDSEDGITIVCGSREALLEALDYYLTEYVQLGSSDNGDFAVKLPDSKLHVGHYIQGKIADSSVKEYSILYYCDNQYYDSRDNAKYFRQYFLQNMGVELLLKDSDCSDTKLDKKYRHKIIIGRTLHPVSQEYYRQKRDLYEYQILHQGDDLFITGGSDVAIRYAIDHLIDEFFSKEISVPFGYCESGNISGEFIYPYYGDANLRIMSNNVWCNFHGNTWEKDRLNSTNQVRYKKMANVYLSYKPDIISFQELLPSHSNSDYLLMEMNAGGGNYKFVDRYATSFVQRNFTPIMYNTETVEVMEAGEYVFPYGSNMGTKSYTWAYLKHKKSGYQFIVFSVHLWWKKETAYAGSTQWRIDQMTEICRKADELIELYHCPCFVMGDFNCKTSAREFGTMVNYHFEDCHDIATEFASNSSGRYLCNEKIFSYKPNAGTYKKNGIDHILVKNLKKARILSYNYALPNFYGMCSDHAPVYIDVKTRG